MSGTHHTSGTRAAPSSAESSSRRLQGVELNDHPAVPRFVRDTITEVLGASLRQSGIYEPAAPLFAEFCHAAGCHRVLDIGSGSGEPVSILLDALTARRLPAPTFYLSDLFPNLAAFDKIQRRHPGQVEAVREPLDARQVPRRFDDCALTIISTFHHFPPEVASSILARAVERSQPVFVLEPFPRDLSRMLPVYWHSIGPSLLNPLTSGRDRLLKLLLTYASPGTLALMGLWDGTMSTLRMYSEAELMELVAPLDGYDWAYRRLPSAAGGEATAFFGLPRAGSADREI